MSPLFLGSGCTQWQSAWVCMYMCVHLGCHSISICHDINGFNMVCHGSQAVSICADQHIFLFENSLRVAVFWRTVWSCLSSTNVHYKNFRVRMINWTNLLIGWTRAVNYISCMSTVQAASPTLFWAAVILMSVICVWNLCTLARAYATFQAHACGINEIFSEYSWLLSFRLAVYLGVWLIFASGATFGMCY